MKKQLSSIFSLMILLVTTSQVSAAAVPLSFNDSDQEQRYRVLIKELRCLVCQNQSLADSNADLAQDLRRQVHSQIVEGHSDDQIVDFMVARYGDFVRYRPPFKPVTYLLWLGPVVLLMVGALTTLRLVRKHACIATVPLEDQQLDFAARLKDDPDNGKVC